MKAPQSDLPAMLLAALAPTAPSFPGAPPASNALPLPRLSAARSAKETRPAGRTDAPRAGRWASQRGAL
eukprot:9241843-Pyramimonas_sp.AAC.1